MKKYIWHNIKYVSRHYTGPINLLNCIFPKYFSVVPFAHVTFVADLKIHFTYSFG